MHVWIQLHKYLVWNETHRAYKDKFFTQVLTLNSPINMKKYYWVQWSRQILLEKLIFKLMVKLKIRLFECRLLQFNWSTVPGMNKISRVYQKDRPAYTKFVAVGTSGFQFSIFIHTNWNKIIYKGPRSAARTDLQFKQVQQS